MSNDWRILLLRRVQSNVTEPNWTGVV